jgi:hypothetical protein
VILFALAVRMSEQPAQGGGVLVRRAGHGVARRKFFAVRANLMRVVVPLAF